MGFLLCSRHRPLNAMHGCKSVGGRATCRYGSRLKLIGSVPVSRLLLSRTTLKPAQPSSARGGAEGRLRHCSNRSPQQRHGDHKLLQTLAAARHHHPTDSAAAAAPTQAQVGSRAGHTDRPGVRGLKARRSLPTLKSGRWPTSWLCERSSVIWPGAATQLCAPLASIHAPSCMPALTLTTGKNVDLAVRGEARPTEKCCPKMSTVDTGL